MNQEQPTPEQIAELKEKHGRIFAVNVEGELIVIIRKPKLRDIERASTASTKKPMEFNASILQNCKVWEKPGALAQDDILQAVYSKLDEIVVIKETEVKEL